MSAARHFSSAMEGRQIGGRLLFAGRNMFVGREPDVPDRIMTVYDSGAGPDAVSGFDGIATAFIQVRIRGNRLISVGTTSEDPYVEAMEFARAIIRRVFEFDFSVQAVGISYSVWTLLSGPLSVGRDERNRPLATVNFRALHSR